MRFHIVKTTDTLDRIAKMYNLSIIEVKANNTHISDWKHLIPGTKIRLPTIPEYLSDELDNTEPFIEDYYPKLNTKTKKFITRTNCRISCSTWRYYKGRISKA